jgi:hypothetical protein
MLVTVRHDGNSLNLVSYFGSNIKILMYSLLYLSSKYMDTVCLTLQQDTHMIVILIHSD